MSPADRHRCGTQYLERYDLDPSANGGDEHLYHAGVLFEEAGSVGAAIAAFALLRRSFPSSKLASKALARTAKLYGDVAMYEESARHLEEYATKYPGEQDAYYAMRDAAYYRKALGDFAKAIENTNYFIKTFRARKPADAASAAFSLTAVYEQQGDVDGVVKYLREYVRQFGTKGGDDRLVIAHAKIGQILWEQSCPVKQMDGSCLTYVRDRAVAHKLHAPKQQPTRCAVASNATLSVVKRDERKRVEALNSFLAATKVFERTGGHTGGDQASARYFYARAKRAEADLDYEASLELALGFVPDKTPTGERVARRRVAEWQANIEAKRQAVTERYQRIIEINDASGALTAMARIGQLEQTVADALARATVPRSVQTGPPEPRTAKAYCDELIAAAEPLRMAAIRTFERCLHGEWGRTWPEGTLLCARKLAELAPEKYPTANELVAPLQFAPRIAIEAPLMPTL